MKFEFDPRKSIANESKHGINFIQAQGLWGDLLRVDVEVPSQDEKRILTIGMVANKHWTSCLDPTWQENPYYFCKTRSR